MSEIEKLEHKDRLSNLEHALVLLSLKDGCFILADAGAGELSILRSESESRRITLEQKAEEVRREWTRAENAEAALEEARYNLACALLLSYPDGPEYKTADIIASRFWDTWQDVKRAAE